jgi:hypothetical protein
VLRRRRRFLVQSVILRDRYRLLLGPYEEEPALHGASGSPNCSAATDGSRRGLQDASIARELIRRRFAQPRPPRLGVHARALGIRSGFADWGLFVYVISDSSAGPKPRGDSRKPAGEPAAAGCHVPVDRGH